MEFQPSVAFVDDDDDLRNANRQTLELAGFAVTPSATRCRNVTQIKAFAILRA